MTTLEQREECLRNHSENGPFPGVGCLPDAKSALPGDPGSTVGPESASNLSNLVGEGRSVFALDDRGKASWDRRVKMEIPAKMSITIEYDEADSAGAAQRCTDAGGKWHSSRDKLILTFPNDEAVTHYYRRLVDDVLAEWPNPNTPKSAKKGMRSLPTGEWRRSHEAGATLLKDFVPTIKDLGDRQIRFTISTGDVDRHGDTVDPNGWELSNYLRNPVVLYGHNYDAPPIGRAVSITKPGDALVAIAQFTTPDLNPMGDSVYRMIKAGFLRATSVGFLPIEYRLADDPTRPHGIEFSKQELLEFSVVPVPANADALSCSVEDGETTDAELVRMIDHALAQATDHYTEREVEMLINAALDYCDLRGGLGRCHTLFQSTTIWQP